MQRNESRSESIDEVVALLGHKMQQEQRRRVAARAVGALAGLLWGGVLSRAHLHSPDRAAVAMAALLAAVAISFSPRRRVAFSLLAVATGLVFVRPYFGGGLAPLLGVKCAALELVAAILTATPSLVAVRINADPPDAAALALSSMAASTIAAAALHLSCHAAADAGHVLLFHALPLIALAPLVYWLATRWRRSLQRG